MHSIEHDCYMISEINGVQCFIFKSFNFGALFYFDKAFAHIYRTYPKFNTVKSLYKDHSKLRSLSL